MMVQDLIALLVQPLDSYFMMALVKNACKNALLIIVFIDIYFLRNFYN